MKPPAPAMATVALTAMVAAAAGAALSDRQPDILLVLVDQLNPRYTSWENPQVRSPRLDELAREGMVFDACYTASPVCVPARISLLTGLYPHNQGHAVWGNPNNHHVDPSVASLFRDMRQAGYSTAQIGKLHWFTGTSLKKDFASAADYYRALGLDTAISIAGPPDSPVISNPHARRLADLGLLDAVARDMRQRYLEDQYEPRPSLCPAEHYHDRTVADLAADHIRRAPTGVPIFLVVSFHSPHPPLDAPEPYASMFDPAAIDLPPNVPASFDRQGRRVLREDVRRMAANYLGKIALVDDAIGRVFDAMKERGTWDRALVIFTADHGEMMGAHGALSKGRFWEESARVPLVARWPGHIRTGRTDALVQMHDVYPTAVEAAGGRMSPGRFARSFLPLAQGRTNAVRDVVLSEIGTDPPMNLMIRSGSIKWWVDGSDEYLFDVRTDPMEMTNLVATASAENRLGEMRRRAIEALRSAQMNAAAGSRSKVRRLRDEAAQHRRE